MKNIFNVTNVDKHYYQNVLKEFLPEQIIDVHTHVFLKEHHWDENSNDSRLARWPERVAQDNPYVDHQETYNLIFPGKKVMSVIFANPMNLKNIDDANKYIENCCESNSDCFGLLLTKPEWSESFVEEKLVKGKFKGIKVYLNFAPSFIAKNDICIFDFLPHHQLEVLNKYGLIVMLHIPRDNRLKDPVNLAQIIEIEKNYPDIKLIIAHVGRAYCKEDVGNAFEVLKKTKNVLFDFSANTNEYVFEQLIKAIGPERILFGSDMPITRMRMKRVCENGNYINIIPKGLYGDISDDSHMREVEGGESEQLTLFIYEEIMAFQKAAKSTHLTNEDIEDVFFNNARRILNF
jgi:predicted TIM-barrel fold metal-dependent hydrolase